ncbi:glycerophosphodiester phosphodiesterase [Paenibacillus gansuensis]|uniref:Glycerophosphodiester phosphodiesterase n=1 Tax=Paenibacillus gansuensis TaxID=306542 RepID=A0ABW5PDT2_9BACL
MNSCAAHRGWSGKAPENTLAAMRLALGEYYVDWMELDVQLTKDGVPVVIHDFTVNRTTNGRGRVKDKTLADIRALDAGSWYSREFAGERVPTLEEVLTLAKGRCKLNIELKNRAGLYPGIESKVAELILAHGMECDTVITSFDVKTIREVRRIHPEMPTGLIIDSRPSDLLQRLREYGADFLSISYKVLTAEFAEEAIRSGFTVMAWTVNEVRDLYRVTKMHPEIIICTNEPDRFKQVMLPNG